jgi:hypothetical protein
MTERTVEGAAAVYAQSNDAARNEVLAFERPADGTLAQGWRFATGGRGTGQPHSPPRARSC